MNQLISAHRTEKHPDLVAGLVARFSANSPPKSNLARHVAATPAPLPTPSRRSGSPPRSARSHGPAIPATVHNCHSRPAVLHCLTARHLRSRNTQRASEVPALVPSHCLPTTCRSWPRSQPGITAPTRKRDLRGGCSISEHPCTRHHMHAGSPLNVTQSYVKPHGPTRPQEHRPFVGISGPRS